jgi:hypothetical protein
MDNVKKPNYLSLFNTENSDFQIIFDEYSDTFFYLEEYIERIDTITTNLIWQFKLVELSDNLPKEIERINTTLEKIDLSIFERETLQSYLNKCNLDLIKLLNLMLNNIEFFSYLKKQIKNINL